MTTFIKIEDEEGSPVIVNVDRIEHVYQYTQALHCAEEQDETITSIVMIRDFKDEEEYDEITTKQSVDDIFDEIMLAQKK